MPVSREKGNVKSLFTYEQYLSVIENEDNWLRMKWKVEGTYLVSVDIGTLEAKAVKRE